MSWYKVHTTAAYTTAQFEPPLTCGGPVPSAVNAAFEQRVIELVNSERAAQGLPPLKRVESLMDAARYHANDMTVDNYLEHDSYERVNGELTFVCAWDERIDSFCPTQWFLGENLAGAIGSPESVMTSWMNSSGHAANILGSYREIGVGYDTNWVQNFRLDPDLYPLIINGEAATTASTAVTLYAYGEWDEIRLRNNGGIWSTWQSFTNTLSWTLDAAPGVQTVDAEFRDATTTVGSSDTIEYISLFTNTHDGLLDVDINGLAAQLLISTTVGVAQGDYTWSGDGDDIFICVPRSLGATTSCTFYAFWDGDTTGFNFYVDSMSIGGGVPPINASTAPRRLSPEEEAEAAMTEWIYLPLVVR